MPESPADKDKLDPRLLPLISSVLALYDIFAIHENGGEALDDEFFEKFKAEGCPGWYFQYNTKQNNWKFWRAVWNEFTAELQGALKRMAEMKATVDQEIAFSEILAKFGEEIVDCILNVLKRKSIKNVLLYYVLSRIFLCPDCSGSILSIFCGMPIMGTRKQS